ncbi:MAG: hypothetical protein COU28_02985 [Candidatus Magasanikbacteria bacterium CG10_big_fil_rev_8_21_14_0_10_36_16]|uniref:Uncharacterized protein n=1 Tax=Candidatus Magasanikbacteria bacterium CG10_big_fil_rev_8_21_14_0_10_36_16 TaxID=1974645 RepID=A0A2H0TY79_9BACT|nr:MAG: hypothetical protein COU28_02985 [Candidatus Magasanikbacteria bacterium CG10_big_fil_rev_8_21_14_0_10_36_16]
MSEKRLYVSMVDHYNFNTKEDLIKYFFENFGQVNITRQDLMWWCKNVDKDSVNDSVLIEQFPNIDDRKEVVKILLKIKDLGLDN